MFFGLLVKLVVGLREPTCHFRAKWRELAADD